jgi:diguanylate cyclase (GGDEF)-like protein
MRRVALLAVSVVAVVVLGGLAVWAQWDTGSTVDRARRIDRVTLQRTLAGLTDQYMSFTFLSTKTAADETSWRLQPNDAYDTAHLKALVSSSPLTRYGAAVVSLTGVPLAAYPSATALPPVTDPGYVPLRQGLLAGKPGLSNVMTVHGNSVVAFAVPITHDGHPMALLVAFADVRAWPLQGYDARLHVGENATSYVVDPNGTIAAASDPSEIGRRLTAYLRVKSWHPAGFVSTGGADDPQILSWGPAGQGWAAVTTQPKSTFSGAVEHSRRMQSLALALLLSIAVVMLVVFHHKRQDALARLADERLYDPLTGLGQRGVLELRLQAAMARRNRHHRPLAVLFCDVDGLKAVNDRHGHNAGDQLLATVAERIRGAIRATDMAARIGGDEFAVVMEEASLEDAAAIAERIRRSVSAAIILNGVEVTPGISVGGAVLSAGESTLDALLHEADMAMYAAKHAGAGQELVNVTGTPALASPLS